MHVTSNLEMPGAVPVQFSQDDGTACFDSICWRRILLHTRKHASRSGTGSHFLGNSSSSGYADLMVSVAMNMWIPVGRRLHLMLYFQLRAGAK